MGIWSRSLLMEIKEATGFAWLQGYVKYIWMVHPQRLYYSMFGLWWIVCVLHKQQITQKVYDTHNNAMDAHVSKGGTPATLYTAHPNTEVKQQLIATLLENMKLMGLTKQGCLLSQHKLTHLD